MKKASIFGISALLTATLALPAVAQDYSCGDRTCVQVAEVFGAKDGNLFVLQDARAEPIRAISFRVGAVIDQLGINFGSADRQFAGANGGYAVKTTLAQGEYISQVTFCTAPWTFSDGSKGTAVSYLRFLASSGAVIEAGTASNNCITQNSSSGFKGFYGYAKEVLTGIGSIQ